VHAQHPERAELLRQFPRRQGAVLEPLLDVRTQSVVGELAHGVPQHAVLLVEVVVEVQEVEAVQGVTHVEHATRRKSGRQPPDDEVDEGRAEPGLDRIPSISPAGAPAGGPIFAAGVGYPPVMPQPLEFDPIDRAGNLWQDRWPGEPSAVYASMRAVTSIMRAHQILIAELDAMLRPFGITFSRYEALVLLVHSKNGSLPLSKIGERLQVHATSVTNVIDRLEAAGLVRREPNPRDGRGTLAVITDDGRKVADKATAEFNAARFAISAVPPADLDRLFEILRVLRVDAGDFTAE
jgi:DNA-binding MarR family transcriptional regulator